MSELRDECELWAGLLSHPKWKQLEEWAEEQKAHRIAAVLSGEQETRKEDIMRGEVFGIALFIEYPRTILESLQVDLDNQAKEQ